MAIPTAIPTAREVLEPPSENIPRSTLSISEQIELQLTQKLSAASASTHMQERHETEVSPWLDVTKWDTYLKGLPLMRGHFFTEKVGARAGGAAVPPRPSRGFLAKYFGEIVGTV